MKVVCLIKAEAEGKHTGSGHQAQADLLQESGSLNFHGYLSRRRVNRQALSGVKKR